MKVEVLKPFIGYPKNVKTSFEVGPANMAKSFIKEAALEEKGLIRAPRPADESSEPD